MKLEIMEASEARKLVDENSPEVLDPYVEKVMANINTEITQRAGLGETFYLTSANLELSEVGLQDFVTERREAFFRPIVEALSSAGYTVKTDEGCFGGGYSIVTISW